MREKLVIIGSGMATARLLEALAEREADFSITVVGEEPRGSYNRILLSSVLSGDKTVADLALLDGDWYRDQGINLVTGHAVTRVDLTQRLLVTEGGLEIAFDRLVFATGSRARVPDIPGATAPGVQAFRSLADLEAMQKQATPGRPAVVIGGGLLGLEAAHGLKELGMEVTVVHRRAWPMNRQLDEEAGELLRQQLETQGMRFALDATPVAVRLNSHGRAGGVELDDGQILRGDLVVFAAGITPNAELAGDAGIPCDRAIVVDEHLRATKEGIYALGECCEIDGRTFGLVAPVWRQADILADTLAGRPGEGYRHLDAPTQLKVSGIDLYSAGQITFDDTCQNQILRDKKSGIYRRLVYKGDRLVGAILLGDRSGGPWYGDLIESGEPVGDRRPWLIYGPEYCSAI